MFFHVFFVWIIVIVLISLGGSISHKIALFTPAVGDATILRKDLIYGAESAIEFGRQKLGLDLELHVNSTSQDSIFNMYQWFQNEQFIGCIGPPFSSQVQNIISNPEDQVTLPMVSYSATASMLGQRSKSFHRVVTSDGQVIQGMVNLLYSLHVNEIMILYDDNEYGKQGRDDLDSVARKRGIFVRGSFLWEDSDAKVNDIKRFLVSHPNVKVIITLLIDNVNAFLSLKSHGLMDMKLMWIAAHTFQYEQLVINQDFYNAAKDVFYFREAGSEWREREFFFLRGNNQKHMTKKMEEDMTQYGYLAYDATLALVFAIQKTLDLGQNPSDPKVLSKNILQSSFLGATGFISFDEFGNRKSISFEVTTGKDGLIATFNHRGIGWINRLQLKLPLDIDPQFILPHTIDGSNAWLTVPKQSTQPSSRHSHCMDSNEREFIIFGGNDFSNFLSELFIYRYEEGFWGQVIPLGRMPSEREGCILFMPQQRQMNRFYIFGGWDGESFLNDLYRVDLDINSVEQVVFSNVDPHPSPRSYSNFVHAPEDNSIYMYGGEIPSGPIGELWKFSLTSEKWTRISTQSTTPPPRSKACMGSLLSDENLREIVLFGGLDILQGEDGLDDTWVFNLQNQTWNQVDVSFRPERRFSAICVNVGNRIYMYSGWTDDSSAPSNLFNDIHTIERIDEKGPITKLNITRISKKVSEVYPARDSVPGVSKGAEIVIFGGWGEERLYNSLIAWSVTTGRMREIHGSNPVPNKLAFHSSVQFSNKMLIFGGTFGQDKVSKRLYELELDESLQSSWKMLEPIGDLPSGRFSHASTMYLDQMFVFGGKNIAGDVNNELYSYRIVTNTWKLIQTNSVNKPQARFGHVMENYERKLIIFGGRGEYTSYATVWEFDLDYETFQEYDRKAPFPHILHCSSALLHYKNRDEMVISGCEDLSRVGEHVIRTLRLDTMEWGLFVDKPITPRSSRHNLLKISNDQLVIINGENNNVIVEHVTLVHRSGQIQQLDLGSSITMAPPRSSSSAIYFGGRIILFGGLGTLRGRLTKSENNILSDTWEAHVGPICSHLNPENCLPCSPGTYESGTQCRHCQKGTFQPLSGQKNCTLCQKGFYGNIEGSVSLCFPCKNGTYQDEEGQSECKQCSSTDLCPIGSSVPFSDSNKREIFALSATQSEVVDGSLEEVQPPPFVLQNLIHTRFYAVLGVACFSFFVSIVLFFIWGFTKFFTFVPQNILKYFDFMFSESHYQEIGFIRRKKTGLGAVFSIGTGLFLLGFVIIVLIMSILGDSNQEMRTLVPNLAIRGEVLSDWIVNITLFDFHGVCVDNSQVCSPYINIESQEIASESSFSRCSKVIRKNQIHCVVSYYCKGCKFLSSEASMELRVTSPDTWTRGFLYHLESTTSNSKSNSSIRGSVYAGDDHFFRGLKTHSSIDVLVIPSQFERSKTVTTGYYFEYQSHQKGSVVDHASFSDGNGMSYKVNFRKSPHTLHSRVMETKSWDFFIVEVLAHITGIFASIAWILSCFECFTKNIKIKLGLTQKKSHLNPSVMTKKQSLLKNKMSLPFEDEDFEDEDQYVMHEDGYFVKKDEIEMNNSM